MQMYLYITLSTALIALNQWSSLMLDAMAQLALQKAVKKDPAILDQMRAVHGSGGNAIGFRPEPAPNPR